MANRRHVGWCCRTVPRKVIPVSLDGEWQQPQFPLTGESRDLKPLLLERGIIDLRSSAEYEAGLRRLVRRLERTRTDEEQD